MANARRLTKVLAYAATLVAALIALVAWWGYNPDLPRDELLARYSTPASRFTTDGAGNRIHYRDEGLRSGPVLLLIHGSNSSLQTWEPLVRKLGKDYRIVSLDLFGHGLTGPNRGNDYSAKSYIAQATRVLDELRIERAVWIGNSMGGWVAWRASLENSDRVSGLVLIDAAGAQTGEPTKPYLGARLLDSWLGRSIVGWFTPRVLIENSLRSNYADPKRLSETTVNRYWDLMRFPGNRDAAAARSQTDREPLKWSEIGRIRIPTLIMWGDSDQVIPFSHGKAFAREIEGSELKVIGSAGHLPMEEQPDKTAETLQTWLASLAS